MSSWLPSREDAHPATQQLAVGAVGHFPKPTAANGFIINADGPFIITFDDSDPSATHGLLIDPGKGGQGILPVTPTSGLGVFNRNNAVINISVAWFEDVSN